MSIVADPSLRFLIGSPEFDALQIEAESRDSGRGGSFAVPDDAEAELNAWHDARPVTEEDVDAMWAEEQARREVQAAEVF